MLTKTLLQMSPRGRLIARIGYCVLLLTLTAVSVCVIALIQSIDSAIKIVEEPYVEPFPLGVDPIAEEIIEQPAVEAFLDQHIVLGPRQPVKNNWWDRIVGTLAQSALIQNLALTSSRVLVIYAGERHEEIATTIGGILRWDLSERNRFITLVQETDPQLQEGIFLPGKYVVAADASPEMVADLVTSQFSRSVLRRYPDDVAQVVPLKDALIVASLLEREAYDFTDMREISGVIWNRLFIDMPLQLDATLQYARGSRPYEPWWPKPQPADKWIDSPYNTYQNKGLPPAPIANPSVEAVLAALNPIVTDCLFYLHAAGGAFYCSPTYEGHQANINTYLR